MGKDRAQRLVQVINKIPLIGGLGPSQVQAVLGACKPMRFEEGDVLCVADTPVEELFILLTGQVGVYAEDDTELAEINAIATIGEMSIATKQNRSSTVKAKQVSNVLLIKRIALDVALRPDPDAQAKILRNVVEILAKRMEQDIARRRGEILERVQLQESMEQLQHRADLALGILARKSDMPLKDARALLEAELGASDDKRRVLIVDDEDHVRKMLAKILANYDVTAVGSRRRGERDGDGVETGPCHHRHPHTRHGWVRPVEKAARVSPRSADPGPVGKDEDVQEYDFDGFAKPMDMEQFKSIVASALVGTSTTLMSCRRNPSTFVRRSIPSRCVALSLWVL